MTTSEIAHYSTADRVGSWMQTVSGGVFFPLDPRPEEVSIYDIAHSLSHQCRYGGHTRWFYSIAEHSVILSRLVDPSLALAMLMHDAAEAFCVDLPRPIKMHMSAYREIEDKILGVILEKYGLPYPQPPPIKEADNRILLNEQDALMNHCVLPWFRQGEPYPDLFFDCWDPPTARRRFLARFYELYKGNES